MTTGGGSYWPRKKLGDLLQQVSGRPGMYDQVSQTVSSISWHIFSVMFMVIWQAQQNHSLYILRDTSPMKMKQVNSFCYFFLKCHVSEILMRLFLYNTFETIMPPAVINSKLWIYKCKNKTWLENRERCDEI